ncbi:putative F-box only protein [Talaromyces proteolyticus]|uniref:F-box only protein n=1 Tax=Talaromyces proteolyticus TaxID=1131652 RepID=A0AAD4KD85_9EURO|nr:putative F-box only protein [Talaromyces proteolyticus]KAH8688899.1 putative F-box only protein [Talaromyces proteolyticus]
MRNSLDTLPDEILHLILQYIDPYGCLALEKTARRFLNITKEPSLWRHYCRTLFLYWDKKYDIQTKMHQPPSSVDWKGLYAQRHKVDMATTQALNDLLSSQSGRIQKVRQIMDFGYDVKDTLLRQAQAQPHQDDHLARRYYSKMMMNCLRRNMAISEWVRLKGDEAVSLERALGCFDLFIPQSQIGSLDEIGAILDTIAENLSNENPRIGDLTPRERASYIASYLHINNLTGIRAGREYHSIEHNFLGIALTDPNHNSLPLISAAIFCYIAQHFHLNARPCGFPFHVHVIIHPVPGFDMEGRTLNGDEIGAPIYMDPFRSGEETRVDDLQNQLNYLGASPLEQSTFLGQSLSSEIVLRCGRNILNSLRVMPEPPDHESLKLDFISAGYASLWSIILVTPRSRLAEIRRHIPWFMDLLDRDYHWDIFLVEQHILPLFEELPEYENFRESLHIMQAVDEMPRRVRKREAENKNIRYRVGEVFCHRRYKYRAIIIGWDAECGAGEQWMRQMNIDQLQAGRHQSFYHAHVEDRSVRYVAEENIEIIRPTLSELPTSLMAVAGKHFKRWNEQERRFVSNIKDEYPDD